MLIHHGSYEGVDRAAEVLSWRRRVKDRISYSLSAHRASMRVTVSDVRRDMVKFYRLAPERVQVIPVVCGGPYARARHHP